MDNNASVLQMKKDGVTEETLRPSPCTVLLFTSYMVSFVVFLTGFIAPYWSVKDLVNSGLWKICAFDICYHYVEDSRIPQSSELKATQAMMILALLSALLCLAAFIAWMFLLDNIFYRGCSWSLSILTGVLNAIGVLVYGAWYEGRPEGWAYWLNVASACSFVLTGALGSCNTRLLDPV